MDYHIAIRSNCDIQLNGESLCMSFSKAQIAEGEIFSLAVLLCLHETASLPETPILSYDMNTSLTRLITSVVDPKVCSMANTSQGPWS